MNFCRSVSKSAITIPLIDQLVRSAASVGANYIEANEAISKKDFYHRIRICRKEAKETNYWLKLLFDNDQQLIVKGQHLLDESMELVKIFSAIINRRTTF